MPFLVYQKRQISHQNISCGIHVAIHGRIAGRAMENFATPQRFIQNTTFAACFRSERFVNNENFAAKVLRAVQKSSFECVMRPSHHFATNRALQFRRHPLGFKYWKEDETVMLA